MTAGIAGGVGVELGPLEIAVGAIADVGHRVDKVAAAVSGLEPQPLHKPFSVNYPGAAAPPTPVQLILPHFPHTGRMWYVTRTSVVGADGHTAVAGAVADIYMGPGQGNVDYPCLVYSGLTIPTVIEEGRYHNPIHSNDRVYAMIYGLPANTPVNLSVLVAEYPVAGMEAMQI